MAVAISTVCKNYVTLYKWGYTEVYSYTISMGVQKNDDQN